MRSEEDQRRKFRWQDELADAAEDAVMDKLDSGLLSGELTWLTAEDVAEQVGERYTEQNVVKGSDGIFYAVEVEVYLHRIGGDVIRGDNA